MEVRQNGLTSDLSAGLGRSSVGLDRLKFHGVKGSQT